MVPLKLNHPSLNLKSYGLCKWGAHYNFDVQVRKSPGHPGKSCQDKNCHGTEPGSNNNKRLFDDAIIV